VESEPTGARVFVDGRSRGVTPLTVDSLAVGTHVVVLDSAKGTVRRTVAITANETARIAETIYTGWLAVASPIELTISEGTQVLRQDERDQFVLAPGSHELILESRALGYREARKVDIRPGEVTRVSITPPASTLAVNATAPAVVSIDGERIGETPIAGHPINLGTRDVTVTAASGTERRFTITVTVAPVKLDVDFSK
jgi:PEGA domain-containing protein